MSERHDGSVSGMDRRTALKVIAAAAAAPGVLGACETPETDPAATASPGRNPLAAGTAWDPDLLDPVVPETARRLREMLALTGVRSSERAGGEGLGWDDAGRSLLPVGHRIGEPGILVRKVEDEEVEAQRALLARRSAGAAGVPEAAPEDAAPYAPLSAEITFDQFAPLDLRVGRIVAAEPHPNADKLLRFDVDLGFETRQILSGVREHLAPEAMVGRRVVVVANLGTRTIRGLESQGMILFAENRDGALLPVEAEGEPGAVVR